MNPATAEYFQGVRRLCDERSETVSMYLFAPTMRGLWLNGVRGTTTHFLLKKYKDDGDLFVDEEPDRRLAVTP